MVEHIPTLEPQFVVDDSAPDDTRQRALRVETAIKERPADYLALLASVGSVAVEALTGEEKPFDGDKITILNQFFDDRIDRFVEFDAETEHSLQVNPYYTHLAGTHAQAAKAGSTTRQEVARDELRYFRMQHFVGRVIAWQEFQAKKTESRNPSDPKDTAKNSLADLPHQAGPKDLRTAI